MQDLRFAFRQLSKSPSFTVVAALTLALGIGANSAIFALVDATLLRPLPYKDPERLVAIWENSPMTARSYVSPPNMLDWNARSRTFEKIAGFIPSVGGMVMAGADGNAETVSRQWVTSGIFDVLGVMPIAGRTFTPDDEARRAQSWCSAKRSGAPDTAAIPPSSGARSGSMVLSGPSWAFFPGVSSC
jgi:putative ABC transport system permease protein